MKSEREGKGEKRVEALDSCDCRMLALATEKMAPRDIQHARNRKEERGTRRRNEN